MFQRVASLCVCLGAVPAIAHAASAPAWPNWGGISLANTRNATAETSISPANVSTLRQLWVFTGRGNFTTTPTVYGSRLYTTDDGGGVYAIDTATGKAVWTHAMSDYGLSVSRSSPAIVGDLLILTDRRSGNVIGVSRATGSLVWKTLVESNPYATLTGSPIVRGKTVFVGTASNEEYEVSASSSYTPTFRGSVAALDAPTGALQWQSYMVPQGYTGGAVWGSGFAVNSNANLVYVATGNNYSVPQAAAACQENADTGPSRLACLAPTDFVDSIVALDMTTGAVRWGHRLQGSDTFTLNCRTSAPAQPCPMPTGPDYDFAQGPSLFNAGTASAPRLVVGAGQKSGVYWALDASSGKIAWRSQPAPGGVRGGIMWGAAVDQSHVYVAENDSAHMAYTPVGASAKFTGGSWAALDVTSGAIAWQTEVPGTQDSAPAGTESAVSVANGVVFAGSTAGDMVAMNAGTGAILWHFASGGGVTCGASIVSGVVYWGSGDPYGTANNKLYAFGLAGK